MCATPRNRGDTSGGWGDGRWRGTEDGDRDFCKIVGDRDRRRGDSGTGKRLKNCLRSNIQKSELEIPPCARRARVTPGMAENGTSSDLWEAPAPSRGLSSLPRNVSPRQERLLSTVRDVSGSRNRTRAGGETSGAVHIELNRPKKEVASSRRPLVRKRSENAVPRQGVGAMCLTADGDTS